jgi:hypothetical protein
MRPDPPCPHFVSSFLHVSLIRYGAGEENRTLMDLAQNKKYKDPLPLRKKEAKDLFGIL